MCFFDFPYDLFYFEIYYMYQYICMQYWIDKSKGWDRISVELYMFDGYNHTILLLSNSHYISICIEAISAIIIYYKDISDFEIIKIKKK